MKTKYIPLLCILIIVSFSSCSDFLTERSQDLSYVNSYKDLDELLLGDAYMESNFNSYAKGYLIYLNLMSDETQENNNIRDYSMLDLTKVRSRYFGYYCWQGNIGKSYDQLSDYPQNADWQAIYKHINVVNMILAEINDKKIDVKKNKADIQRIKGEAYFLRAAYYFLLTNLYGKPFDNNASENLSVPVKTTEFVEDKHFSRNTIATVYGQIQKDLDESEKYLKNAEYKSVYRANIEALYILRSRVCLYMQDWKKAQEYAQAAIHKNRTLQDLNTLDIIHTPFNRKESPETVFSMGTYGVHEYIANYTMGIGVRKSLYDLFDVGDLRKAAFFKTHPDGIVCRKYVVSSGEYSYGSGNVSDCYLIRRAEAYLNLAEAAAYNKEEQTARDALGMLLRNRLTRQSYTNPIETGKDLINRIRLERRKELCFEMHRWFDLRRWAVCSVHPLVETIKNTYSTYKKKNYAYVVESTKEYTLSMNDWGNTLPIPLEVITYDGMVQNERGNREGITK